MWKLILAQLVVCLVQYYIATTEKIKNIYWVTFFFNLANMLCYLLNKDYTTVFLYVLICVRTFVYIFRDKLKGHKWSVVIPIGFMVLQVAVGLTTLTSPWQLIPTITATYVCYYMWFYDTTQKLRIGNIIGNTNWGIYNTITGLYIVAVGRLITVVFNLIAYYKNRKGKRKQ